MKRMLYLAIGLLAVAACTRQPVIPEDPVTDPEEEKLIDVTLIAGIPETRTEVWANPGTGKFLPYWSAGEETIGLVRIPEDLDGLELLSEDAFGYPDHSSPTSSSDTRSENRYFVVRTPAGHYLAYYPEWHDEVLDGEGNRVQEPYGCDAWLDSDMTGHFAWTVPQIQHPRKDSFDPTADCMISETPIGVSGGGTLGTIVVGFTRLNAIVRVVLQDKQTQGDDMAFPLAGQHVRKVVLGNYSDDEDEEDGPFLSGDIEYRFRHDGGNNELEYEGDDDVVAEYTDATTYVIGEEGAGTFFITLPCILRQSENLLRIKVETDDYLIERAITLPVDVALQPSRLTTLNIGLYDDGVNGTRYYRRGLSILRYDNDQEDWVPAESLEVEFGESIYTELRVGLIGITPPNEEISDFFFGPAESEVVKLRDWMYYDADENYVEGFCFYGIKPGNDVFSVQLSVDGTVYTASIPVTVVLGEKGRSLDGNYGENNEAGGGINDNNHVEGGEY